MDLSTEAIKLLELKFILEIGHAYGVDNKLLNYIGNPDTDGFKANFVTMVSKNHQLPFLLFRKVTKPAKALEFLQTAFKEAKSLGCGQFVIHSVPPEVLEHLGAWLGTTRRSFAVLACEACIYLNKIYDFPQPVSGNKPNVFMVNYFMNYLENVNVLFSESMLLPAAQSKIALKQLASPTFDYRFIAIKAKDVFNIKHPLCDVDLFTEYLVASKGDTPYWFVDL